MLNEKTVNKPRNQVTKPVITEARRRLTSLFSTNHATAGSIKEMAELHAAKTKSKKNKPPKKAPPGIWPKAMGNV